MKNKAQVIDRLLMFVEWAKEGGLVRSRTDFEKQCGLSKNYLYNTQLLTKSSIGTDKLEMIYKEFPMINLVWVITGKGAMITSKPDNGYKNAYTELQKQLKLLQKQLDEIIKSNTKTIPMREK